MKKFVSVFLLAALILSVCACGQSAPKETTVPTTAIPVETTVPETDPPETTEPDQPKAAFADYEYIYENERDSLWEQDVVYFAKLYLGELVVKGHPYLTARRIGITDLENTVTQRYFYDAQLRDTFIAEIKNLIGRLPELTDGQITYELSRIVALLGDAHSQVLGPDYELFPIVVEQMEHNGQLGLYVTRIPQKHAELIYSKLVSINGVEVPEVIQRLRPFVPSENQYWAMQCITSIFNSMMIVDKTALQAAGIVGLEENSAEFLFEDADGQQVKLTLEAADLINGDYWKHTYVNRTPVALDMLSYSQYGETSYFFKYLQEDSTMYLRLYDCSADAEYRLEEYIDDVDQELRVIGAVDKIIVDIRDNPGGYIHFVDKMIKFLKEADTKHIYVITDNGSFSAGTIFPNRAKAKLENITIVGEPTGQTPNFFAGATTLKLRKHDVYFTISMSYFEGDANFTEEALIPDLPLYQNLEDYKNGIDTALHTVLDLP